MKTLHFSMFKFSIKMQCRFVRKKIVNKYNELSKELKKKKLMNMKKKNNNLEIKSKNLINLL